MRFNYKKELKISNGLKTISYYEGLELNKKRKNKILVLTIYVILAFLMAIVNFVSSYYRSVYVSLMIGFGLLVCIILDRSYNKTLLSDLMSVGLINVVLTIYAIFENVEGFSLLWVLILMPLYCSINKYAGIGATIYTLIFVCIVCYVPLGFNVINLYSDTFLLRFPILCIGIYLIYYLMYINKK